VKCQLCHKDATGLVVLRVYTSEGIHVCGECYQAVDRHRHQPYSRVMERLAMAEAGYQANRKQARLRRQ
jgi:ribosome-binding protein aMBF1 (putative translation factor)